MATRHNILISGADDFIAPFLYNEIDRRLGNGSDIWLLGTGERAGIKVDLSADCPGLPCPMNAVVHCDATSRLYDRDCSRLVTAARNLTAALELNRLPDHMVYISTCDVYGREEGESLGEDTPCTPSTPYGEAKLEVERILSGWCVSHGVSLAVLRAPHVVGTGMGGEMRRLVNRVYRCTYRHVGEDNARVSVVHATSLAEAVAQVSGRTGVWNVTDLHDPTMHDLVEALAWRLDNKRVYGVSPKKARIMARVGDYLPITGYDSAILKRQLATLTFSGMKLAGDVGFMPVSVVDYLRNHVYDENSL